MVGSLVSVVNGVGQFLVASARSLPSASLLVQQTHFARDPCGLKTTEDDDSAAGGTHFKCTALPVTQNPHGGNI